MAVVSAVSVPAIASAINNAVTSITIAVAVATNRPGSYIRATTNAYTEHTFRIARIFIKAVKDLIIKSY